MDGIYSPLNACCYREQCRAAIERARVEGFNEGVDRVCTPRTWSIDMDHAWHRAIPDVRKAFADLAAAIRKN